jgi:hypothetical protein
VRTVRRLALLAALSLAAACGGPENEYAKTLRGEVPPALETSGVTWLNTDVPLTLAGLRGKVVYLEFGFRG